MKTQHVLLERIMLQHTTTTDNGLSSLLKKHLLFTLFTLLFFQKLIAQEFTLDTPVNRSLHLYADGYTKAIGVKMYPGALSYKSFYKLNKAIEASGYITLDGFWLSILNEIHTPIYEDTQLSWYIGYGGHLGIWSEEWRKKNNTLDKSNISVGFDGIIGLDYKVKNSPLNVSIDWQPSFSIIQGYFKNQGGIGIRYTLK
jgi:hypothetical protein